MTKIIAQDGRDTYDSLLRKYRALRTVVVLVVGGSVALMSFVIGLFYLEHQVLPQNWAPYALVVVVLVAFDGHYLVSFIRIRKKLKDIEKRTQR
jgi:hypothetical protein